MKYVSKILLLLTLVLIGLLAALVFSGGGPVDQTAQLIVYHEGREYIVLDRGDEPGAGTPTYFVRYLSKNPNNDIVRMAECADLYAVVAKHIDANEHQRVVIYAVAEEGGLFGLLPPREVVESLSVEQVLEYLPEPTTTK
jgi:hypothetical protein